MRGTRSILLLGTAFVLAPASPGLAALDTDTPMIMVRSIPAGTVPDPCSGIDNCFTWNVATGQWTPEDPWGSPTAWIWQERAPSADQPLLVDVGPGEFGPFLCSNGGYVTLRGSGRENSIVKSSSIAMSITSCVHLEFLDIGAHGGFAAVTWTGDGTGDSVWSNVDLVAIPGFSTQRYGWFDDCSQPRTDRHVHYFHGSRIRAIGEAGDTGLFGYSSYCGETWFYGGEILASSVGGATANAIDLKRVADFRAFGTAIRATGDGTQDQFVIGVSLLPKSFLDLPTPLPDSVFHMHGGIINASAPPGSAGAVTAVGISVAGGCLAHTPGTGFFVQGSATGASKRVSGTGQILSPFLWQAGTAPPAVQSQDGSDLFVETDCAGSGCASAGDEPHLLIYSEAKCGSADPWFDTVTGSCR